ncbi:MAG: diaminopimelate epimerase [Clostridiales bacterium]|jgi:diaminopimelate epimerase|nr:diaminopimelate epimerase [Clostridiales bacterium]
MRLKFTKMQGVGNDYIFFDCRGNTIKDPSPLAARLSDRHFGVGGDGMVLIERSSVADVGMRMFNADGSEGKMCGNAVRCVAKYVYDDKTVDKAVVSVETAAGIKKIALLFDGAGHAFKARVSMGNATFTPEEIPASVEDAADTPLTLTDGSIVRAVCVGVGNPHCVVFCGNGIDSDKIGRLGPLIERHPAFPDRTNVEFVNVLSENSIKMRVWERGSGETYACGTGACAAVAAAVRRGYFAFNTEIAVICRGGELAVVCGDGYELSLTGDAVRVFDGETDV